MRKYFVGLITLSLILPINIVKAETLVDKLKGKILLQVEENGEAWYVNPGDKQRYFLGRPQTAFEIMRDLGIGITNRDLAKIPVALDHQTGIDTDGDGLADNFEIAFGTSPYAIDSDQDGFDDKAELEQGFNPNGLGNIVYDFNFATEHQGKIFLQVEENGEAWYVNPGDKQRYFLGRPTDAFNLMRALGLGISNENLAEIPAHGAAYTASDLENKIFIAVNEQRMDNNLKNLQWNDELAAVARAHSENLAKENEAFTGMGMSCTYPIIHHEGLDFGAYNSDRLQSREVYYYQAAAENIALVPVVTTQILFSGNDSRQEKFYACPEKRADMDTAFKAELDASEEEVDKLARVKEEISLRTEAYSEEVPLQIYKQDWLADVEVVDETVTGWMNSLGHRANILDKDFDETGVGTAIVNGYLISTQVFIKRAVCGYKTGDCCEQTGYYPYCFVSLTCENSVCQ